MNLCGTLQTPSNITFHRASSFPTTRPAWDAREVHLWLVSLDQPLSRIPDLSALLSDDERHRADRLHFGRDRRRYVVAHALLRKLLGAYLGEPPTLIRFVSTPFGKPVLNDDGNGCRLHFNLAHSGKFVLFGLSQAEELGVDLEVPRAGGDLLGIADRFFAPMERLMLRSVPDQQLYDAFYNAWTRKEAYIKAIGRGLSEPLDGVEVTLRPGEPARLLRLDDCHGDAAAWSLYDLRPFPGVVGAVAIRGLGWQVSAWHC